MLGLWKVALTFGVPASHLLCHLRPPAAVLHHGLPQSLVFFRVPGAFVDTGEDLVPPLPAVLVGAARYPQCYPFPVTGPTVFCWNTIDSVNGPEVPGRVATAINTYIGAPPRYGVYRLPQESTCVGRRGQLRQVLRGSGA